MNRIKMKKILGILSLILIVSANALAQDKIVITLEDCIDIAHGKSPRSEIARKNFSQRHYGYQAFSAGYMPQLSLGAELPGLNRGVRKVPLEDGTFRFVENATMSSSALLSLEQKLSFSGGTLGFASGLQRTDDLNPNEFDTVPHSWFSTPVQLYYRQPIFRFNSMKWERKIEDMRNSMSDNEFNEEMESIAIRATDLFFSLYLAKKDLENSEFNRNVNDTLYQLSKGRFEVGRIAENELLQSELKYLNSQNNVETKQLNYERAIENLVLYLGLEEHTEIEVVPPASIPKIEVDLLLAIEQAKSNNTRYLNYDMDEMEAEKNIEIAKSDASLNADLTVSFGLNTTADYIKDAYRDLSDQERLNISLSVPIINWGYGNARIQNAIINQEKINTTLKIDRQNFELDVKYQVLRFTQLQKQLILRAKSDTIATKRFEVTRNRYLIGKIDLNAYFIAQNEKDQSRNSYMAAIKEFWLGYYNLRRMTMYDFINDKTIMYSQPKIY
jgi:outer membrane protein TolC